MDRQNDKTTAKSDRPGQTARHGRTQEQTGTRKAAQEQTGTHTYLYRSRQPESNSARLTLPALPSIPDGPDRVPRLDRVCWHHSGRHNPGELSGTETRTVACYASCTDSKYYLPIYAR